MNILHLTLKKKFFDMIASGEKLEEYREIKPYWISRFADGHKGKIGGDFMDDHKCIAYIFKKFQAVKFTNGYGNKAPSITVECLGIQIGYGMMSWGAENNKKYFVIQLGKVLSNEQRKQLIEQP